VRNARNAVCHVFQVGSSTLKESAEVLAPKGTKSAPLLVMAGDAARAAPQTGKERPPPRFIEVFHDNLDRELDVISSLVALGKYKLVAMDAEFPGVVVRPLGNFDSPEDFQYQTIRCNVDLLKVIQIGICLADTEGSLPTTEEAPAGNVWQFNFEFSLARDIYAQSSVEMLQEAGIKFDVLQERGIDPIYFGELLITSGLVMNPDVTWITFHSGYDFGYLVKTCTADLMPATRQAFYELLSILFPNFLDIKSFMPSLQLHGGLNKLAETLRVRRHGPAHQAASDALLTLDVFNRLARVHANFIAFDQFLNKLYGLSFPTSVDVTNTSMQAQPQNALEMNALLEDTDRIRSEDGSGFAKPAV
jgi:CCR4-NOT transcription complex subunit 7/8